MSENERGRSAALAATLKRWLTRLSRATAQVRHREREEIVVTSAASADPVTALLPAILPPSRTRERRRVDAAETDEVLPSGLRFSYHLRRRIVRRAMLFCLVTALICVLAVTVLSAVRVQTVTVSGHSVYTEPELLALSGIQVGDELYACDEDAAKTSLLEACPYLKDVRVRRVSGGYAIEVTECEPRYALLLEDGRVALMDETRYVAEVRDGGEIPEGLCAVLTPLPPLTQEKEDGEIELLDQIPTAGAYVQGDCAELMLLDALGQALEAMPLACEAVLIDLSDRYDVRLTLTDGTTVALHSALQPERALRAVAASLEVYLATHAAIPETSTIALDVDDRCRVSLRVVPKG